MRTMVIEFPIDVTTLSKRTHYQFLSCESLSVLTSTCRPEVHRLLERRGVQRIDDVHNCAGPIDKLPMFVRAGAIFRWTQKCCTTGKKRKDSDTRSVSVWQVAADGGCRVY